LVRHWSAIPVKFTDGETMNTEICPPSVVASRTQGKAFTSVAKGMRTFLLFILATNLINNAGIADLDLAGQQWKKRVVVVLAPSENDPDLKSQQAIAAKASAEFLERDLTLISEIAEGPLHQKYGVSSHRFQVLMIGKDGHTAANWSTPITSAELFSIIDVMPMRRDEIRQKTRANTPAAETGQ
jgi:hypothetical protein